MFSEFAVKPAKIDIQIYRAQSDALVNLLCGPVNYEPTGLSMDKKQKFLTVIGMPSGAQQSCRRRVLPISALMLILFASGCGSRAPVDVDHLSIAELASRAERGQVQCQTKLGEVYIDGRGVVQDFAEGQKWLNRAALGGSAAAAYDMALVYLSGRV